MLAAGDVIYDTFDPVSLSDLLGKLVFQNGEDETRWYPVFTCCLHAIRHCHAGICPADRLD